MNHGGNVPYSDYSGNLCNSMLQVSNLDFNPQFPTQNLDNIPPILDEVFTEIVQLDSPFMTTTQSRPDQQMPPYSSPTAPSEQQRGMFMATQSSPVYATVASNSQQQMQQFKQPRLSQQTVMSTTQAQLMSPPPPPVSQSQGMSPTQQQTSSPLSQSAAAMKSPCQSASSSPTSDSDDSLPLSQVSWVSYAYLG